MRRFHLFRLEDATGISGTGYVAEGCVFSNGHVALAWTTEYTSIAIYDSILDVIAIHGHGGKTTVEWQDGKTYLQ